MRIDLTPSFIIQNQISGTARALNKSLERLSSGKRINSPRDDFAGFNQSIGLDAQIRGLRQATLNVNSTAAMLITAEAGMDSQIDLVSKMRELAVQASNGTLSSDDRENISTEINSLLMEFIRLSDETEYAGTKLLNGSLVSKDIQIGSRSDDLLNLSLPDVRAGNILTKVVGNGAFQSRTTYAGATTYGKLATDDINGDGHVDLVSSASSGGYLIRLNNGDGTFASATTGGVPSSADTDDVALQDVDGDGILDVVTSDVSSGIGVHIGNGDGTFQSRITAVSSFSVEDITFGDFNGDGKLDIAGAYEGNTYVTYALGNGDGTFQTAKTTSALPTGPLDVAAGDMDGDGIDDLVAHDSDGTVLVFLSHGDGTFASGVTQTAWPGVLIPVFGDIKLSDLNGDEKLDVLVTEGASGNIYTLLGNGDGTLRTAEITDSGSAGAMMLDVGDLNGDGIPDLVATVTTAGTTGVHYWAGNGNGTFSSQKVLAYSNAFDVELADANGDGVLDIISNSIVDSNISYFQGYTQNQFKQTYFDLTTSDKAQDLIKILDDALVNIQTERSKISAIHSRLDETAAGNLLLAENLEAAKSQIEDTDLALDVAEMVRLQILEKAQVAVLTQAHLSVQAVTQLLNFEK